MSQNELSQIVFMFSDKHTDILESKNEFTEIQEALQNCLQFQDLEIDLIPKYKFFQIKKNKILRKSHE